MIRCKRLSSATTPEQGEQDPWFFANSRRHVGTGENDVLLFCRIKRALKAELAELRADRDSVVSTATRSASIVEVFNTPIYASPASSKASRDAPPRMEPNA